MTTYLGKSCSFGLPRVPFVNCRQFMYLVISLLVLRAGCGIWLYQFLIIAYLFTSPKSDCTRSRLAKSRTYSLMALILITVFLTKHDWYGVEAAAKFQTLYGLTLRFDAVYDIAFKANMPLTELAQLLSLIGNKSNSNILWLLSDTLNWLKPCLEKICLPGFQPG